MTLPLDPSATERLAKLCGMFGSAHAGERASAAALADKLVRSLGLTWPQVLLPASRQGVSERITGTPRKQIELALKHLEILTPWERKFIRSIARKSKLTDKQNAVLDDRSKTVSAD